MKKHISLLLAVLMIVTMLPIGVSADATLTVTKVTDSIGAQLLTDGTAQIATVEGELTLEFEAGTEISQATLDGAGIVIEGSGDTPPIFKGAVVATVD